MKRTKRLAVLAGAAASITALGLFLANAPVAADEPTARPHHVAASATVRTPTQSMERQLQHRVRQLLEGSVGEGHAVVGVKVELDNARITHLEVSVVVNRVDGDLPLAELSSLVSEAVGLDKTRGDRLEMRAALPNT